MLVGKNARNFLFSFAKSKTVEEANNGIGWNNKVEFHRNNTDYSNFIAKFIHLTCLYFLLRIPF